MAKRKKIDTVKERATNPFAALVSEGTASKSDEPPPPQAPDVGFPNKIVLQREKKGRGGKTITRIKGLPIKRLDALRKQLKKALGCGAVVEGTDLLLLGSVVDRAGDWLEGKGASKVVRGN